MCLETSTYSSPSREQLLIIIQIELIDLHEFLHTGSLSFQKQQERCYWMMVSGLTMHSIQYISPQHIILNFQLSFSSNYLKSIIKKST